MDTQFSEHALERVSERLSMPQHELAEMLNKNMTVDIGFEQGSNRMHRLFYSKQDRLCFLAIQDMKNGTVVTVIPADNHGTTRHVSLDAQVKAQQLVEELPESCGKTEYFFKVAGQKQVKKVKFTGYVTDEQGQLKVIYFTVRSVNICLGSRRDLADNPDFIESFRERLLKVTVQKKCHPSRIQSLYARIGNKKGLLHLDDETIEKLLEPTISRERVISCN